jgi:large subunit ribosomal protein L4
MAEIAVKDWKNKTIRKLKLDDAVFEYPYKEHLIFEAMLAFRAAGRRGTHKAKNRVEVSGGSRKPWRQKGTGRARVGDNRSPLWRHGGTVHGPRPRDYSWSFPKRMRRNAIKSALAQKHREGKLLCLDALDLESPKTRALEQLVSEGLKVSGKALLLQDESNSNLELAARNNPRLTVVRALGASVVDLLGHETVIVSEPALLKLAEVLAR